MGAFKNLRLRRKLLIAMAATRLMVLVAGVYSSIESKMIDGWYSVLIDDQVEALRNVGEARAHTNRFGSISVRADRETIPIDATRLMGTWKKFAAITTPRWPRRLNKAPSARTRSMRATLFDRAETDARPVRAAALAGNSVKARSLMHGGATRSYNRRAKRQSRSWRICKIYRSTF